MSEHTRLRPHEPDSEFDLYLVSTKLIHQVKEKFKQDNIYFIYQFNT
jgi:hypothetical protein